MNRYTTIKKGISSEGKKYSTTVVYPEVPVSENDIYIITTGGDRYDTLALQFYNDPSLWWIIAGSNTSKRSSLVVEPGVQLRIPADKNFALDLFEQVNKTR